MHGIGTFCTVGGRHWCALFGVDGESFHTHLAPPSFQSHTMQLGANLFCPVLLLSGVAGMSVSDELSSVDGLSTFGLVASKVSSSYVGPYATGILLSTGWSLLLLLPSRMTRMSSSDKLAFVDGSSTSGLVASRVSFSEVGPNTIGILPSADRSLLSLSLLDGGIGPWKGCRSFMWHRTPLTLTKWWLTTPVTFPSLKLVVHQLPRGFIQMGSSTVYVLCLSFFSGVRTVWIPFSQTWYL